MLSGTDWNFVEIVSSLSNLVLNAIKISGLSDERQPVRICTRCGTEYRKEYKVRGGVEMTGKGEPWHTKEEEED